MTRRISFLFFFKGPVEHRVVQEPLSYLFLNPAVGQGGLLILPSPRLGTGMAHLGDEFAVRVARRYSPGTSEVTSDSRLAVSGDPSENSNPSFGTANMPIILKHPIRIQAYILRQYDVFITPMFHQVALATEHVLFRPAQVAAQRVPQTQFSAPSEAFSLDAIARDVGLFLAHFCLAPGSVARRRLCTC